MQRARAFDARVALALLRLLRLLFGSQMAANLFPARKCIHCTITSSKRGHIKAPSIGYERARLLFAIKRSNVSSNLITNLSRRTSLAPRRSQLLLMELFVLGRKLAARFCSENEPMTTRRFFLAQVQTRIPRAWPLCCVWSAQTRARSGTRRDVAVATGRSLARAPPPRLWSDL